MGSRSLRLLNKSTHSRVGELDGFEVSPWPAPMDHLGLVETVDGFGESIVIGISDTADGWLQSSTKPACAVREARQPTILRA